MAVFGKQESHKLGMHGLDAPEFPAQEAADKTAIHCRLIAREMDVTQALQPTFEIGTEHPYLRGFSGSVEPFENYQHRLQR